MLRIKNDIDLKILEKYGLKPHYIMTNQETGETRIAYFLSSKYECRWGYMRLKPRKKYLCFWLPSRNFDNCLKNKYLFIEDEDFLDMDLLYDLIKADLVEKVD